MKKVAGAAAGVQAGRYVQATDVELSRLAAIVASSNDAIVSKDLNGIIASWNRAAEKIFGYRAEEIVGRHITTIIPPELHAEETDIISKVRRGERVEHYDTVRVTKDGRRIQVSLTVSPVRNGAGEIVGASKIARDITERKRNEEFQRILVNELNHRTKNLLATVQAIAGQTFSKVPEAAEQLDLFRKRIVALTASQDLLTRNAWREVSLRHMLETVLRPFSGDLSQIRIGQGVDLHLNLRQTNALAMAFHELATNATKYGALSTDDGVVSVEWHLADDRLELEWVERDGPPVSPPDRKGFGSQMIKDALKHELGAEVDLEYAPAGLRFHAALPLLHQSTP